MKVNQSGFTLGQLVIVIVLLAGITMGGIIFLQHQKQSEQTQKIEAMLTEMKARVGTTLLEQDQSATFGDAIKKAEDNAAKADEALVQLKTLDQSLDPNKIQAATKIVTAVRDLMRYQRKLARTQVELVSLLGQAKTTVEGMGESTYALRAWEGYKQKIDESRAESSEAGDHRLAALVQLIIATESAKDLFSAQALIDLPTYKNALETLKALKQKSQNEQ
jgi:hypothetical protein